MANTVTHINENEIRTVLRSARSKSTEPSKGEWIQDHAKRILRLWSQWQTPLGIACTYAEQIREDLAEFYDDPLKRMFIETTYC
ncbi:hypothetical protein ACFL5Z_13335 [Planctomycetota bacterium]